MASAVSLGVASVSKKGVSDLHPIIAKLEVTTIKEEKRISLSSGIGFIKILKVSLSFKSKGIFLVHPCVVVMASDHSSVVNLQV